MLYLRNEQGQGLAEYALVIVLVSIVVIAILAVLGPQLKVVYEKIIDYLKEANGM